MRLNTSNLNVQYYVAIGDLNKSKPWSKYAPKNAVQQDNDKSEKKLNMKTKKNSGIC